MRRQRVYVAWQSMGTGWCLSDQVLAAPQRCFLYGALADLHACVVVWPAVFVVYPCYTRKIGVWCCCTLEWTGGSTLCVSAPG